MPAIPAARREQSQAPPAQRVAWYCPLGCKPRNDPMGHAQNSKAAELAGLRHFHETHDNPPGQENTP